MSKELPIAPSEPAHPDARTDLKGWAEYAKEKIDGRPVIVSVSGGKDSLAVGLLLKSAGIPFEAIHMATGWEAPSHAGYLAYLETILGPIRILKSPLGGFADLVRKYRMFPSGRMRFCTRILKLEPMQKYLKSLQLEGLDPLNAIGVRAGESRARSKLGEWEWQPKFDCDVWRPILRWEEADVIALHHEHGAKPNPLYTAGARRVGCYPCVFVSKEDIRRLAESDPERIEELAALERESWALATAHYEALGKPVPAHWKTFFENPRHAKSVAESVTWSKTAHGGKQFEMFSAPNDGCLSWGLCS